jgi:hypothetical protein
MPLRTLTLALAAAATLPFGLKEIEAGQIRVIAKATDSALVRGQRGRPRRGQRSPDCAIAR